MFHYKIVLAALACCTSLSMLAQTQREKKVTDQAEYDLFLNIQKEMDPARKLTLLDTWKQQYPESDYKVDRLVIYATVYQQLRQGEKMLEAAREILSIEPDNVAGLVYVTALTESLRNTSPDRLEYGESAARRLLANLDRIFALSSKPANVTSEVWASERAKLELQARKALLFVHVSRKNYAAVESEATAILKLRPNAGIVSYQLGSAIVARKEPDQQARALYHIARAAYATGEDALPEASRKDVQAYLDRVYTSFHGSKEGLSALIDMARKAAFPPPGFEIKSHQQILADQENKIKQENPQLALWIFSIKRPLSAPGGKEFFESQIKDAELPPLRGRLVSASPATRPKEILVALADGAAEVKLVLNRPMANAASPGTELEFRGIAREFRADPFLLTLELDQEKLSGWPAVPPAPARGPR